MSIIHWLQPILSLITPIFMHTLPDVSRATAALEIGRVVLGSLIMGIGVCGLAVVARGRE